MERISKTKVNYKDKSDSNLSASGSVTLLIVSCKNQLTSENFHLNPSRAIMYQFDSMAQFIKPHDEGYTGQNLSPGGALQEWTAACPFISLSSIPSKNVIKCNYLKATPSFKAVNWRYSQPVK